MEATRAAVLTVSDGVTHGTRADESGDVAVELLREAGFEVSDRRVVPDERPDIESALRELAATHGLVVTTGGTGFGPRDVTPEATQAVIERAAPGLAELMRATGLAHTPMAALSRAVAGALGGTLIPPPGSPRAFASRSRGLPVIRTRWSSWRRGGGIDRLAATRIRGRQGGAPHRGRAKAVRIIAAALRGGNAMSIGRVRGPAPSRAE